MEVDIDPSLPCIQIPVANNGNVDDVCWEHMDIGRYLFFNTAFVLLHDSVLHPLELLKARQQHYSGNKMPLNAITNAKLIVRREGIQGLFRGLIPSTIGNVPGQLIYFGVYEYLKQIMLDFDKQGTERHSWLGSKAAIGFAAGFSADILSLITHTPGEVISVRLMVSTTQLDYRPGCIEATVPVPTARQVFADLWRANGFSGLYRGLGGSIISHGPASAAYFCTYEGAKDFLHKDRHQPPPVSTYLIAGAMAGAASVLVSNPLEVAKVRIQTADLDKKNIGFWSTAFRVIHEEGFSGMAKGIGPRLVMAVPGSALTFACYEIVKKLSLKSNEDQLFSSI